MFNQMYNKVTGADKGTFKKALDLIDPIRTAQNPTLQFVREEEDGINEVIYFTQLLAHPTFMDALRKFAASDDTEPNARSNRAEFKAKLEEKFPNVIKCLQKDGCLVAEEKVTREQLYKPKAGEKDNDRFLKAIAPKLKDKKNSTTLDSIAKYASPLGLFNNWFGGTTDTIYNDGIPKCNISPSQRHIEDMQIDLDIDKDGKLNRITMDMEATVSFFRMNTEAPKKDGLPMNGTLDARIIIVPIGEQERERTVQYMPPKEARELLEKMFPREPEPEKRVSLKT